MKNNVKFAIIGAGSVSFCPGTVTDILLNKRFGELDAVEIFLMDIKPEPLELSRAFCAEVARALGKTPVIKASTNLSEAVEGADFVITAIEVDRTHYWSQDFHIPRRYGFRQIFGENGGPGGMFHFLRNVGPMLEVARAMEKGCAPGAWLLNYSNPEAKLVDAIAKLTDVNVTGLCHGEIMGIHQIGHLLDMPDDDLDVEGGGLNHFGWFTKIKRKSTGEDLYPRLREAEKQIDWLANWDAYALPRLMLRTYGLWSYPGANHVGEYIAWSDELLASAKLQYFYDPAEIDPWETRKTPEFVYHISDKLTSRTFITKADEDPADNYKQAFKLKDQELASSNELGIQIAESVFFNVKRRMGAVNVQNKGYIPNVLQDMAVEVPAIVDGDGIHPVTLPALPTAVASMISLQGGIHQLLIEAYQEQSRIKLLQAMLLDPTVSSYNNAVALINQMCEMQAQILPPMHW